MGDPGGSGGLIRPLDQPLDQPLDPLGLDPQNSPKTGWFQEGSQFQNQWDPRVVPRLELPSLDSEVWSCPVWILKRGIAYVFVKAAETMALRCVQDTRPLCAGGTIQLGVALLPGPYVRTASDTGTDSDRTLCRYSMTSSTWT